MSEKYVGHHRELDGIHNDIQILMAKIDGNKNYERIEIFAYDNHNR